jgi:hypothetical protein
MGAPDGGACHIEIRTGTRIDRTFAGESIVSPCRFVIYANAPNDPFLVVFNWAFVILLPLRDDHRQTYWRNLFATRTNVKINRAKAPVGMVTSISQPMTPRS